MTDPFTAADSVPGGRKGLFITFEGIDGSGKSVQTSALVRRLISDHYPVLHVREPGGPPIAEQIRRMLLDKDNEEMAPLTELFLYEAARAQLVAERILPALEKGVIVVSDRFVDSTTAYQAFGRRLPLELIESMNRMAAGAAWPDQTILLDISWNESRRRRQLGGEESDRMESNVAHFFHRVIEGYREIAMKDPVRVYRLDGGASIESLTKTIETRIYKVIKDHKIDKNLSR